jgi:hypothetical protein
LSRNVGKRLPLDAALYSRRAQISELRKVWNLRKRIPYWWHTDTETGRKSNTDWVLLTCIHVYFSFVTVKHFIFCILITFILNSCPTSVFTLKYVTKIEWKII